MGFFAFDMRDRSYLEFEFEISQQSKGACDKLIKDQGLSPMHIRREKIARDHGYTLIYK